jgi:hypothetical protein
MVVDDITVCSERLGTVLREEERIKDEGGRMKAEG